MTANDVWFTPAMAGDGTPLRVAGIASATGTTLDVALPPAAGPGDVLVKVPGTASQHLSNAFLLLLRDGVQQVTVAEDSQVPLEVVEENTGPIHRVSRQAQVVLVTVMPISRFSAIAREIEQQG